MASNNAWSVWRISGSPSRLGVAIFYEITLKCGVQRNARERWVCSTGTAESPGTTTVEALRAT